MKQLTKEQFDRLSPYEPYFKTAVYGSWSRYPGASALEVIHGILEEVTGQSRPLNTNCQSCVLTLLQDCGALYFRKVVELSAAPATPVKKVSVKTRTKKTK